MIHCSILTPTAIGRGSQRWMQWVRPGSDVGEMTGSWTWTSRAFFDNLDQNLLLRAVKKHASQQWMVLYIERWLKAPVEEENGQVVPRQKGTPQGGVVSPLLANLFLHYALDRWMAANYPQVPFERYADDVIVHCRTEKASQGDDGRQLRSGCWTVDWNSIRRRRRSSIARMSLRKGRHTDEKFDFLGYEFRPRKSINRNGKVFTNFSPAVSTKAAKSMRDNHPELAPAAMQSSSLWKICPASTIRLSEAGSNTTGGITVRRFTR